MPNVPQVFNFHEGIWYAFIYATLCVSLVDSFEDGCFDRKYFFLPYISGCVFCILCSCIIH